MKALARSLVLAAVLTAVGPLAAQAGGGYGWGGGYRGYHHGGAYYRHHHGDYDSGDLFVAFGLGTLLGVLSGWASAPSAQAPGYRPGYAPTRVITCVENEVWRYLPDGRIQTGIRRTCY